MRCIVIQRKYYLQTGTWRWLNTEEGGRSRCASRNTEVGTIGHVTEDGGNNRAEFIMEYPQGDREEQALAAAEGRRIPPILLNGKENVGRKQAFFLLSFR